MEENVKNPRLLKSFKSNIANVFNAIDFAFKNSELYSFKVHYQLVWNDKPKKQADEKYQVVKPFIMNVMNASTIDVIYEDDNITIKMEPKEHICPICGKGYYGFGKREDDGTFICPSCADQRLLEKVYEMKSTE